MFLNGWMGKQPVLHLYSGILVINKKELTTDTSNDTLYDILEGQNYRDRK